MLSSCGESSKDSISIIWLNTSTSGSSEPDTTEPTDNGANLQFTVSNDNDGDSIAITWTAFNDANLSDHRIVTYTNSSCDAGEVDHGYTGSSSNINSSSVTGLANGTYYATVTAYDSSGNSTVSNCSTDYITVGAFVSIWRTTGPNETITLPLRAGYTYNFTVNWGDGTPDSTITSDGDAEKIHIYTIASDYTVTILGTLEAWYFNNGGDKDKIISVPDLGSVGWTNLRGAFFGCTNLTSLTGGDTSTVTTMQTMFRGTTSLSSLDLTSFDTSNVTTMLLMFETASALTSLDLSSFNTSLVEDFGFMFDHATGLTTLDLSNFDTSSADNMTEMFQGAAGLTSINLSSFDTSGVTNMSAMFSGAIGLTSLDLSSFDTSLVTTMDSMFRLTSSLTYLDVTDWDISSPPTSTNIFTLKNAGLVVMCNQGGTPGTGMFFTEPCDAPPT